jgi:hypothetical protein
MIAYCPLEDLEPPPQRRPEVAVAPQKPQPEKGDEDTELNYVILAFIVGVVMLAVSDSMTK